MDKSLDRLKAMIEKRKENIKRSGSEIFAIWGLVLLSGLLVKSFLINSEWIKYITILAGVIIQIAYVKIRYKKEGLELVWNNDMNFMWIFMVIIIVIAGIIFPVYFKLYSPDTGSALMYFFAAPGVFISGLWLKKWSIKFSTVIFILAAVLLALPWQVNKIAINIASIVLGLIIPGIMSRFEGKDSSQSARGNL
ncbi:MAG: hypothetical protein ABSG94_06780 [Brevinematales bacterium]|jgi:hypothetical protein